MSHPTKYMVTSRDAPKVELTDAGLYVRFLMHAKVRKTIIQNEWPHIAVDLDESGNVIGIECVPAPAAFSIGMIDEIARDACVGGLPDYDPAKVEIENLSAA